MMTVSSFHRMLPKKLSATIATIAAGVALAVGSTVPAQAASTGLALPMSISLFNDCIVSTAPLAFGSVSGISTGVDTTSTVTMACTLTTPYTISMNAGTSTGATTTNRSLTGTSGGSTYRLSYTISRDSAETQNWGMVANTDTASGTGTGLYKTWTVYGHLNSVQGMPAGVTYSDSVTVAVNF